jgi:hypothetical protein
LYEFIKSEHVQIILDRAPEQAHAVLEHVQIMSTSVRILLGSLLFAALAIGGFLLLDHGLYGLTIFMAAPVLIGGFAVWIAWPKTVGGAAGIGAVAVLCLLCFLLLAGREGLGCLLMAAPLALPLAAVGGLLVREVTGSRKPGRRLTLLLMMPGVILPWDFVAKPPVFKVHSSITIAAPPQVVWRNVLTFSELPEPDEWFFRAGLAYPKRARIEGSGPGAIRYCEFSTGPFVEPITVWDEARLLRFRVTENPAPMNEWSPYAKVLPRHLHGYLISKQGEFRLTALPGNRTLLEGTTWYQHGLWPAQYWSWWSEAIIHRIHLRVLTHIQRLSENS